MIIAYLEWCRRRRWWILLGALLAFAGGGWLASRLELRTSFAELLPSDDPGVVALAKAQKRMGDMSLLLIGISSPDRAANLAYAEQLTRKLDQLPPNICALATYHLRDLRSFFQDNRWLYVSEPDLDTIRDRLRTEIARRKNPMLLDLGGDEESITDLHKRLTGRDVLGGRFADGTFSRQGGEYLWIAALPPGGMFVEGAGESLLEAARALIAADPPERHHPGMRAHVGGPIATAIANRRAVERDILSVTLTCLALVALSLGLYFRRLKPVLFLAVPAALGAVLAFAATELIFGHLNSSTAFLGSIIVGNGINYAMVLLARYEEERALGHPAMLAVTTAVAGVWKGTLVAALSAAVAYGSLVVTSFRGFSQFGVMGAIGWLLCWLATFMLIPVLLLTFDRQRAAVVGQGGVRPPRIAWLGRAIERRAPRFLLGCLVVTALALVGMRHFLDDPFEYDFRKLNTRTQSTEQAQRFDRSMDDLFGRWPSPTVVLADSLEDVPRLKAAIRRQDAAAPGPDVIGQVTTVFDLLPGTPAEQTRKLGLIAQIRRLASDPALEVLDEKERQRLLDVTPPAGLRVLAPGDLPPLARRPFTEADGTVGRVVLLYPVEQGLSVWNGRDLLRIAAATQVLTLDDGRQVQTSGSAVIFGAMIRSVLHDGPIATLAAALSVLLIVSLTMRPWRWAALALGALLVGVTWMIGAAGWAGVKITFLNFIALPITLGLGIEYALNVLARYRETGNAPEAVASTGGAVALCSWTTIVGYGSLLAAQNQALRGFGAMAILSEVSCLSAAVIALPAFLVWRSRRRTTPP